MELTECRVGILVPFMNTNLEKDLARHPLPQVSYYVTRLSGYSGDKVPDLAEMRAMGQSDLSEPLRLIAGVRPHVVMYGCNSACMSLGLDYTRQLEEKIAAATGAQAVSAAGALVEALQTLDVRRVALASPYVAELNDEVCDFLAAASIEVTGRADHDAILDNYGQGAIRPEEVFQLAKRADTASAEAIVLTCTDLRALEAVQAIEDALGKPVVTSNQAMIWATARRLGLEDRQTGLPGALIDL